MNLEINANKILKKNGNQAFLRQVSLNKIGDGGG
jgi:hypothetical protein